MKDKAGQTSKMIVYSEIDKYSQQLRTFLDDMWKMDAENSRKTLDKRFIIRQYVKLIREGKKQFYQ